MTIFARPATPLAIGLALALAACSGGPKAPPRSPGQVAAPMTDIENILTLLDQGDREGARKRIAEGLKRDPMNASLQVLRDSVDRDPEELLGPKSYSYTVRPGETMSELATRFLGNRLKAYQLARYNGIDRPVSLAAGQALRIPGEPPRVEAPRRPDPKPESRPEPATRPRPTAAKPAPAKPTASVANPAAARRSRAAGLAALNQGKVANAVGLLRRAATLDPGNPVIARDLARAQRIAATVRARR